MDFTALILAELARKGYTPLKSKQLAKMTYIHADPPSVVDDFDSSTGRAATNTSR